MFILHIAITHFLFSVLDIHFSRTTNLQKIIDSTKLFAFGEEKESVLAMVREYNRYKSNVVKNRKYDPKSSLLGRLWLLSSSNICFFSASAEEYPTLEMVEIYFGASTYDEIEKDVRVTVEAALGLVGGTMGLLTGFSILSGVEIIYYFVKFLLSLRIEMSNEQV